MGRGIGQWIDDRTGPTVGDDERQRIFMFRTNVDEMNVESVDLRHELRQGIQPGLDLPPIMFRPPIARDLLNRCELHALRWIRDRLLIWPVGRSDTAA